MEKELEPESKQQSLQELKKRFEPPQMKGAVKTRSTAESMQKVVESPCSVKTVEQTEKETELGTEIRSVQKLIEFHQHLVAITGAPHLKVPGGKNMTPQAGASSAAPHLAFHGRRKMTPHAEMKGAVKTRSTAESMQKVVESPCSVKTVEQTEKETELGTEIRSVQELIEFHQHLVPVSAALHLKVPGEKNMTPHAGRTVDRNTRAQAEWKRNMNEKPDVLQNKLEVSQHAAPPPEELANTQTSLQAISEKMQSVMTSLQNTEASRKQDLEILRAEIQGRISNDLEAAKRSWSEENMLEINNKLGRTVDRNTMRALDSMREEVERILSEKLAELQSQLGASQHAAPPPEELANTQTSLQAISEKMQSLMTSLQNAEASRKQDLEVLRAEIQGRISKYLEAAKRSSSEENLLETNKKQEELQAQGRAQGDAEKESLKKENELLHAQRYKVDVTLDADTAHPRLQVSEDGKNVTDTGAIRRVPSMMKRFDSHTFVLAKEGYASGRIYWEVDVGKRRNWILGVAQETVTRKGEMVLSPQNGFWAIGVADGRDYWAYTDPWTRLTVSGRPRKIGIFLDISAKKLSFYNVHQKNALYTFTFDSDHSQKVRLFPFFSTGSITGKVDTDILQIAQGFDDDEK